MTTPTSPDRLPEVDAGRLAPTIDAIVEGDFSRSRLTALSDLNRSRAAYLRQRWLDIPPTERHALMLVLAELAGESVEFNFNRVYRVALEDPDPVIRQLAIGDLWEDEGEDLPRIFLNILREDATDDVRAAAADALSATTDAIAEGGSRVLDRAELIGILAEIIEDPTESPIVRRRALGTIAAFSDDPGFPSSFGSLWKKTIRRSSPAPFMQWAERRVNAGFRSWLTFFRVTMRSFASKPLALRASSVMRTSCRSLPRSSMTPIPRFALQHSTRSVPLAAKRQSACCGRSNKMTSSKKK